MKNWIEKFRGRIAAASPKLSNAVYLPLGLIWSALFLVFTDLCVVLFAQPLAYWIGKNQAESSLPFIKMLLDSGVWVYALTGLVYLLIVWLLLTILTRSAALTLWVAVCFVHFSHTLRWLAVKFLYSENPSVPDFAITFSNAFAALACGLLLALILMRPAREVSTKRFVRWLKPGFALVWACALVGLLIFQAVSHHSGWQPITPEHTPGMRANSNIAYDSKRQVFVMFGGLSDFLGGSFNFANDTWEWDGKDWKEIKTSTTPSPRANSSMAYDAKRGLVVMFGGNSKDEISTLNDTWTFDGLDWKLMKSGYAPQPRRDAQMFYDPVSEKIILSGGIYRPDKGKDYKNYQDIWEWDGEKWTAGRASQNKIIITRQNTTWDKFNNRTLLYNYDRMMEWADGKWSPLELDAFPGLRWGTMMTANPNNGDVLLFGGGSPEKERDDTWVLKGNSWSELFPGMKPSGREGFLLFYDPKRESYILYGGWNNNKLKNDMWEYVIPE
jgi:hypothetical protein